jgi:hypothetical protein
MLASGLTTVGLIAISPDTLPPAAAASLLILSFGLVMLGIKRSGSGGSVSA